MRPRQNRIQIARDRSYIKAGMVTVPFNLRISQSQPYPPDNFMPFEKWYMESYRDSDREDRLYLPIQWTALYCNNQYGKCRKTLLQIQSFLDGLDQDKKYYTLVQYDDGILNDISKLDIKVFAMSGPRIDFSLPLLSTPHKYSFDVKKDIFASFIGRVTHPIRAEMVNQLDGKDGYYISTRPHNLREYCEIMARSKYALCPRGYGPTSFRIQEAIQYGAIPVYISDEFIFPYNMPTFVFGLKLDWEPGLFDYFNIRTWLKANEEIISPDFYPMIIEKNKGLFTYEGCKKEIISHLKKECNDM